MRLAPLFLASLALFGNPVAAAELPPFDYPADLPPQQQALLALDKAPQIAAAAASMNAATADRQRLEAGPYEWAVRVESQRRNVVSPTSQRYGEWRASLERPLRLPAKASLDADLGRQGVAVAEAAYGDARHETARSLLRLWFNWLRERENAHQWQHQAELLGQQQQATARRLQLGDAARLELMQAEAATAQAQAALEQARLKETVAATELRVRFPELVLPTTVSVGSPQPIEADLPTWRERLLAHNHELMLARREAERARLIAARSDADRVPDPTVGVHVGSDRSNEERLAGISLSIPLPGQARAAVSTRDLALAEAASRREAVALAKVGAEIATAFATADAAYQSWRRADEAATRIETTADLTVRARSLGEAGLAEVLLARRQANEARLTATAARLDALESRYRLHLDAHTLWPGEDNDEEPQ